LATKARFTNTDVAAFLDGFCEAIASGGQLTLLPVMAFLALERVPDLRSVDREETQNCISSNCDVLSRLHTVQRCLIDDGVDSYLCPLLCTQPGNWTSSLLQALGRSHEALSMLEVMVLHPEPVQDLMEDLDAAMVSLDDARCQLDDLDLSAVPGSQSQSTQDAFGPPADNREFASDQSVKRYTRQTLPSEFRDLGESDGEPLTAEYLTEWFDLTASDLTRAVGNGQITKRAKLNRAYVYLFEEAHRLRAAKKPRPPEK